MASMKRPRFASLQALPNHKLRMIFVDGSQAMVDFVPLIKESPGLRPLRDKSVFAQVCIGEDAGWTAEWPSHDTLWLDAQAQNAEDENTRVFAQWRARNGLTLKQAAQALGMTPRTISAYGSGKRPVPRYIALAVKGWDAEHGYS